MASAFAQVIAAIKPEFDAVALSAGRTSPWPPAKWLTGRLAAKSNKAPPYVAWVRGDGLVGSPKYIGRPCGIGNAAFAPLYELRQRVVAYCCHIDEEQTENLHADVLRAVYAIMGANSGVLGFHWITQDEDRAAYALASAELVVQQWEWTLMVPQAPEGGGDLVTITAADPPGEVLIAASVLR